MLLAASWPLTHLLPNIMPDIYKQLAASSYHGPIEYEKFFDVNN